MACAECGLSLWRVGPDGSAARVQKFAMILFFPIAINFRKFFKLEDFSRGLWQVAEDVPMEERSLWGLWIFIFENFRW